MNIPRFVCSPFPWYIIFAIIMAVLVLSMTGCIKPNPNQLHIPI
jgi:hypothetical protein